MQISKADKAGFGKTGALVIFLAAASYMACYNPDIKDGFLACNFKGTVDEQCPEGFVCNATTSKCVKSSGTGGTTGTGGGSGTGGVIGTGGAGQMCVGPLPTCKTPPGSTGTCDPTCQSGCACDQRCALSGAQVTCQPDNKGAKKVGDACGGEGPQVLVDDCRAGSICLEEYDPAVCGKHCFRYCKDDSDCPGNAHCTVKLEVGNTDTGVKACENPPESCSPVFGAGNCTRADRPSPQFGCYVMGGGYPDEAVCDCAGTVKEDEPCQLERECTPGMVCIDPAGGSKSRCKRVCPLRADATSLTICGATRVCTQFVNSPRWGFCK